MGFIISQVQGSNPLGIGIITVSAFSSLETDSDYDIDIDLTRIMNLRMIDSLVDII
jgi:hypothetical protein